jgi:ABC-type sugar transport system ATPase subunit
MDADLILEFRDINKNFPGVKALQNVTFGVRRGEVHAIVGENGAGKSTLMKIVAGLYTPDGGQVVLNGQPVVLHDAHTALRMGIAMVPQELNLVPEASVAENIVLGIEPRGFLGVVKGREQTRRAREILDSLGVDIDTSRKVGTLSVAEQQILQIARSLAYQCQVLILDEPTAALSLREKDALFERLRKLHQLGTTILYISHRMEEIFEISDRITVLRDGLWIGTVDRSAATREQVVQMMIGRPLTEFLHVRRRRMQAGDPLLEVRNLTRRGQFEDVSFILRGGEILGFAGLVGAGRTEVMNCIFGAESADSGEILLKGKPVTIGSPTEAIVLGIGYVPEERKRLGIFPVLSVLQNLTLPFLKRFQHATVVDGRAEQQEGQVLAQQLRVNTPSLSHPINNLSGGNQQKVILGRWLGSGAGILILDEPTRGIDINAKAEIHALIAGLSENGKSVILVSSEMQELTAICDRIVVMRRGSVTGIVDAEAATQEELFRLAVLGDQLVSDAAGSDDVRDAVRFAGGAPS